MTGPGAYPAQPWVMRQASSNADPWAGDVEHSPAFMDAIKNGTPISELRRQSADDAMMRATTSRRYPVMWHTREGSPVRTRRARAAVGHSPPVD